MSSTSSSRSDCDDYCQYPCGFDGHYYAAPFQTGRPPVYSMGHPLIYYAQVQHKPMTRRQSSRESRKGNRNNCFMKAFRWYTQEHVPAQKSPDISGFATWLDAKYGEYLRDSRLNQASQSSLQLKQTPTPEPGANSDLCNACANKKTARCRSPWRKRRRASKEAGDVVDKPKKSFLYIMHPKDSPQPVSDCCRTTPTSMHKKSTATLMSSDTESVNKAKMKSQSLTYCCIRKESPNKSPVQDVKNDREAEQLKKVISPEAKETKILKPKKVTPKEEDEITCECFKDKVVNINNETQYDHSKAKPKCSADQMKPDPVQTINQKQSKTGANVMLQKDVTKKKSVQQTSILCQCSEETIKKIDAHSQYQTEFWARPNMTSQSYGTCNCKEMQLTSAACRQPCANAKETAYIKNITFTRTRPYTILVSDVAQTSDHSIILEKETGYRYPLFMKIVCADKLN